MRGAYMSEFDKYTKREEARERKGRKVEDEEPEEEEAEEQQEEEPDTTLNDKEKKSILSKYLKSENFRRREERIKVMKETDNTKTRQTTVLFLAALGGVFIFMAYQYIKEPWVLILMMVMGSCMFLPVGMIAGWVFLDSYMRCRIMRRMTHKNYGIVNFIGKGNKMVSKMKNFDNDLIWIKDKCWSIRKGMIVLLNKDGNAIVNDKKEVDPQSIVTMMDTVPVMFVDLDSLEPLSFNREPREQINPVELAANINSYIDNQLAKIMFLRKTMDIYFMIVIIASVAAVGLAYLNMNNMNDVLAKMKIIQSQLDTIASQLAPP
jgi:DNA-binding TFAR19-related protein (PDSD5 family)